MNNVTIILLFLTWYLSGVISFIYWWTKEYDYVGFFTILISLFAGTAGPVSYPLGYLIHGGSS